MELPAASRPGYRTALFYPYNNVACFGRFRLLEERSLVCLQPGVVSLSPRLQADRATVRRYFIPITMSPVLDDSDSWKNVAWFACNQDFSSHHKNVILRAASSQGRTLWSITDEIKLSAVRIFLP